MNRWLNDPRLRRLATANGVLLIMVIALAVYVYVSRGPRNDARDDRQSFEQRLSRARGDLAELRSGTEAASLREELEKLESTTPATFPPLGNALEFGTIVTEFAAARQIALDTFDVASGSYDASGSPLPAISYSIKAHGAVESLAPLLSLPAQFPTAIVQSLEFKRPEKADGDWSVLLTLVVVHSGE